MKNENKLSAVGAHFLAPDANEAESRLLERAHFCAQFSGDFAQRAKKILETLPAYNLLELDELESVSIFETEDDGVLTGNISLQIKTWTNSESDLYGAAAAAAAKIGFEIVDKAQDGDTHFFELAPGKGLN